MKAEKIHAIFPRIYPPLQTKKNIVKQEKQPSYLPLHFFSFSTRTREGKRGKKGTKKIDS